MEPHVLGFLRRRYGEPEHVLREVPAGMGAIDLVLVYPGRPHVVAVELKIRDWRRLFRQALRNLLYANLSFAALDARHIRPADRGFPETYGFGLLAVHRDGSVEVLVEPRPSPFFPDRAELLLGRYRALAIAD